MMAIVTRSGESSSIGSNAFVRSEISSGISREPITPIIFGLFSCLVLYLKMK